MNERDPMNGPEYSAALPCPFCGNLPHLQQKSYTSGPDIVSTFHFVCPNRMCAARVGFLVVEYSLEDALRVWNDQRATKKLLRLEALAWECASMRHADYKTAETAWKNLENELHNNPTRIEV